MVAPTLAALTDALTAETGTPPLVADLSLGAWRSHQAAHELLEQAGIAVPRSPVERTHRSGVRTLSYADFVSAGVDAEAAGTGTVLRALELADALVAAALQERCPRTFVVMAPRFGLEWEPEEAQFVEILAARAQPPLRLVVVEDGPGDPDEAGSPPLAGLVPGVLDTPCRVALEDAGEATGPLIPLAGGRFLVAPGSRRPPAAVSRLRYDRLHALARDMKCEWLEAYAQHRGNNIYVDAHAMSGWAWERFEEGMGSLALRLMERAAGAAHVPDKPWLEVQLAGMRLGLARFEAAAAADDPSPGYDRAVRGFLLAGKGWGLVMGADPTSAEPYLEQARHLQRPEDGLRELLYLLNISALSKLKAGDLDAALALERAIEARRADLAVPDRPLEYVNSINIARLLARAGDLEAARRYYDQAFATTLGARTESDAVYGNVCMARVDATCGRAQDALAGWVRAALHWLSAQAPEALALRVATSIVGRPLAPDEDVVAEVSRSLAEHVRAAAEAAGTSIPEASGDAAPAFAPASRDLAAGGIAVGVPGWSVVTAVRSQQGRARGTAHHDLHRLLWQLVRQRAPAGLPEPGCVLVDGCHGTEVPTTAVELLASAVRLGVARVWFDGWEADLDGGARDRLEAASTVAPGPALERIDDVDGRRVAVFKRYRAPYPLSPVEAEVVERCLAGPTTVAALAARSVPLALLRGLEAVRALTLTLTEAACSEAGFRLPTSATS